MGYVGIPLSCLLAQAGSDVVGLDISPARVKILNAGKYPLKGEEPNLPELLAEQVGKKALRASTDFSECKDAKAVFICVDTPIDAKKEPRFDHLMDAVNSVGENISAGVLVVVESTIAPGTMRGRVLPALEKKSGLKAGKDLFLAHCPERVMSGKLLNNLKNVDRVLGGFDRRSTEMAIKWYAPIIKAKLHTTDMTSAEVAKTAENAYRDVQIAFANEVGLICEKLGLDAFEVRRLVNTCPYRDMHVPGAGVGGHCLPKDPWLLAYGGREADPKLIPAARRVNDSMPAHVAELAIEAMKEAGVKKGKDTCVAIFGLAFLDNAGDTRNSPASAVIGQLKGKYRVIGHDPYVEEFEGVEIIKDLDAALKMADCAIFLTRHKEYTMLTLDRIAGLMRNKIVIDGRNGFDKRRAEELGMTYKGIGKG
jgi:UDP-N-acetyl-D-mannosaminuronic acid dehydrogenase